MLKLASNSSMSSRKAIHSPQQCGIIDPGQRYRWGIDEGRDVRSLGLCGGHVRFAFAPSCFHWLSRSAIRAPPRPRQRPGHYGHRLLDGGKIAAARDHLVEQGDGAFGADEIVGHAEWLGSGHVLAPSTTVGVAGPS